MTDNKLLDALGARGVLISVSVRYWRARKKLNPEDLGLSRDQVNDRLISLGHKRLLPKDTLRELALVESRAHAVVEESTFPFLNVARYLPNPKLQAVTDRLDELRLDFAHAQAAFQANYADLRDSALREWRSTADDLGVDPELLVTKVDAAFPAPDRMDRYFGFSVNLFQVAVPDIPQTDMIERATQEHVIAARESAAVAARQAIQQSCQTFIAESVAALREQTAKLCDEMLGTINGSGSVHQKTLNRLAKFIDQFSELNFMNDHQMADQLERVRKQFLSQTAEAYRDDDAARQKLVGGLTALRERAVAMATADATQLVEQFGQMGRRRFQLVA
jgi:hypothetical protein